jgi:hypothetical protein
MPDSRFEHYLDEGADVMWSPADAIARRGRQRRRRQRVVGAAAGLAIVAAVVVAGLATRGPETIDFAPPPATRPPASVASVPPSGTPPSGSGQSATGSASAGSVAPPTGTALSSRPPLTTVPPTAMLQAADVGSGDWRVQEETMGDWNLAYAFSLCEAAGSMTVPRTAVRDRTVSRGTGTDYVQQRVTLYPGDGAARVLDAIRSNASRCATFSAKRGGEPFTVRIVHEGFAADADDSFVVEFTGSGQTTRHTVVRRGSLVAELGIAPSDEATVLSVGRAAATRLAATPGVG